jgi:DNA-binding IclR family transcriptional regulator
METTVHKTKNSELDRYNVRVLERALRLLEELADGSSMKLSDLSESLEMSSSTVYRLLTTLANYGYVDHNSRTGGYKLGFACLELAHSFLRSNDIRRIALPVLEDLRDISTETVHLAVLNHWEVVYLEKLENLHAIGAMGSRAGGRSPAYCTGLGKVLLAFADPGEVRIHFDQDGMISFTALTITNPDNLMDHLKQIRAQGYALDMGEHEEDVQCVAAPIRDIEGNVIAAISVSGPRSRLRLENSCDDLIASIVHASEKISSRLGYLQPR